MSFVTILTPLFNGIEYFEECYNSVVGQTETNWKWIIGVNGHEEDSLHLNISDPRILIKYYTTKGKVDTLNKMMEDVSTEYICLLDVDDVWFATKLEVQKKILNEHSFIDVLSSNCQYIGELNHVPNLPSGRVTLETLFQINPIVNSSIIMKSKLAFWKNRFHLEDYDLWFRLALENKVLVSIPEPLIFHRIHSASAFNSSGIQNPNALIQYYKNQVKDITVVSAYYPVKSKNSIDDYLKWLEFWKHIPCNLVFFTTPELVETLDSIRSNYKEKTKIISLPFLELEAFKRYNQEMWINEKLKDDEHYHTPELYVLWYEKKEFVKKAIEQNYFNTSKFIWCDAGICRHNEWIPQLLNFPRCDRISNTKFNVLRITDFENENDFQKINCVGGGILAATKEVWLTYYSKYDTMLKTYLEQNRFIGKDQSIIASMIQNEPEFFELIPIIDEFKESGYFCWFSLLFYFSR
uniref:Glycosyltransferase 2-like domain-containing protein n=1 Tax=viral metagenome TaxID=1070528 RepID=A0A6C0D7C8_9ZZZZ